MIFQHNKSNKALFMSADNRKASSKSSGNGSNSSKKSNFLYKPPAATGLIPGLPLLRYSIKMEDQMSVKFLAWKDKLYRYVQNNGNYSPKVAKIFRNQDVEDDPLPLPPQQPDDGSEIPWHLKEAWKDSRKRVVDRNEKLADDKRKLFVLILDQCDEKLRQKLSSKAAWTNLQNSENPVELLNLINTVCLTPGNLSEGERKRTARKSYTNIFQDKYETVGDFRKRFNAALETLAQVGETQPDEETKAIDFALALNRNRFGQFQVDYRNGILGTLDTVDEVQERAEADVTIARSDREGARPGQIFYCSETPTKQSGNIIISKEKANKQKKNKSPKGTKTKKYYRKKIFVIYVVRMIIGPLNALKDPRRNLEKNQVFNIKP